MAIQNCWDFNKCGRGPKEIGTAEHQVCPAARETSCTGINRGKNAGRMCWAVAGTFAKGRILGEFAKEHSCLNCDFLKTVCKEEEICRLNLLKPYDLYHFKSRIFGRRKFMRVDSHFDIEFKPLNCTTDLIGVTGDFSFEGFSLVFEAFNFTSGEPFEFNLIHPRSKDPAYIVGDVIWKKQVRDRCLAGIKFRFINSETKHNLLDYTYNKWRKGAQLPL